VAWRNKPEQGTESEQARFLELCRRYHLIESWVGEIQDESLPIIRRQPLSHSFEWAQALAERTFKQLNLGDYPALSLEKTLEEEYSVKIFHWPELKGSAASESGLCIWEERIEKLADVFASAMLLPADLVKKEIDQRVRAHVITWRDLAELAETFAVSKQAFVWRLVTLKYLTQINAQKLLNESAFLQTEHNTGIRKDASIFPERYLRLLKTAYLRGEVATGRVAEMLNRTLPEMRRELIQWEEEEAGATNLVRLA
jgi:hypothetical protein